MKKWWLVVLILWLLTVPITCSGSSLFYGSTFTGTHEVVGMRIGCEKWGWSKCYEVMMLSDSVFFGAGFQGRWGRFRVGSMAGIYGKGSAGPDLGYEVEFHSFVEAIIGVGVVSLSHISNAGLGNRNPGINLLTAGLRF